MHIKKYLVTKSVKSTQVAGNGHDDIFYIVILVPIHTEGKCILKTPETKRNGRSEGLLKTVMEQPQLYNNCVEKAMAVKLAQNAESAYVRNTYTRKVLTYQDY